MTLFSGRVRFFERISAMIIIGAEHQKLWKKSAHKIGSIEAT